MMDAVDGTGLIAVLVFVACVSVVLYVVIRLAVTHAIVSARRSFENARKHSAPL